MVDSKHFSWYILGACASKATIKKTALPLLHDWQPNKLHRVNACSALVRGNATSIAPYKIATTKGTPNRRSKNAFQNSINRSKKYWNRFHKTATATALPFAESFPVMLCLPPDISHIGVSPPLCVILGVDSSQLSQHPQFITGSYRPRTNSWIPLL